MAEYINKDVLIEHIKNAYWADFDTKEVIALINQVPTADVQSEIEKLEKESEDKERAYIDEYCLRKEWQEKCKELLEKKYVANPKLCRCGRYKKET